MSKMKLTKREIEVLKALKTLGLEWLARDRNRELFVYDTKPVKTSTCWWGDNNWYFNKEYRVLFNFIKWIDDEPTKIDDLLKGVKL